MGNNQRNKLYYLSSNQLNSTEMKKTNYLALLFIAVLSLFLISCSQEENDNSQKENDNRCFTVKVLVVEDDVIYGEIEQVPENNILKEADHEIHVFRGTKITFPSKDIGFQLSENDIIDIRLIKYELYKGWNLGLYSTPIIAQKVILCK